MAGKRLPGSSGYFNDKMLAILEGDTKKPTKKPASKPTKTVKKGK